MEKVFPANCIGKDGKSWAVYFSTETREQSEHIVETLGLVTDEAGVCEFIEAIDNRLN